jgi:alpha-glucosidase
VPRDFFAGAPDGWPMWAFSNHDVVRHASRWAPHGASVQALAKQAGMLLLSFQGSICLWQGEELGQTDTELALEELTDPQGINFWPEPIGRDNTRTPMVWDASVNGGFSRGNGKPWLPIKAPQLARNVAAQLGQTGSVLETYRAMIADRKSVV